jgi:hypothetical protein
MHHHAENHRRTGLRAASLFTASLVVGLAFVTNEAAAERGDRVYEHAWACSTLFSRYPIKVRNSDASETAVCLGEGKEGRPPMSRSEAWELCHEQFDTTSQFISWTSKGWHCRYYPR